MKKWLLIDTVDKLEEVSLKLQSAKVLAVDTETTGLDPHTKRLRLIQIAVEGSPTVGLHDQRPGTVDPHAFERFELPNLVEFLPTLVPQQLTALLLDPVNDFAQPLEELELNPDPCLQTGFQGLALPVT